LHRIFYFGGEGGFGSPCPWRSRAKTVRWTVFRAWTLAVFAHTNKREGGMPASRYTKKSSYGKYEDFYFFTFTSSLFTFLLNTRILEK